MPRPSWIYISPDMQNINGTFGTLVQSRRGAGFSVFKSGTLQIKFGTLQIKCLTPTHLCTHTAWQY